MGERTQPDTITLREAAERIGISLNTAHKLARDGRFPSLVIRAGAKYFVPVVPFNKLFEGEPVFVRGTMIGRRRIRKSEIEILQLLADGYTRKEVALRRGVSEHTIRQQIRDLYQTAGVGTILEAVRWGVKNGYITFP